MSYVSSKLRTRIILVRHGESHGNLDEKTYVETPDWKIPLSEKGHAQAKKSGLELKELIGDDNVFFYSSPYVRTRETMQGLKEAFNNSQLMGEKQEPRLAEQQFGNFQNLDEINKAKKERNRFGRFFYRFPNGESGLDVYSRMASFMNTLFHDLEARHKGFKDLDKLNIIIVTHGLSLRLFLMRWFHLTVEGFEQLWNPSNAGYVIMEKCPWARSQSCIGRKEQRNWTGHTHSGIQCIPSVAGTFENWVVSGETAIRMGLVRRVEEASRDNVGQVSPSGELFPLLPES